MYLISFDGGVGRIHIEQALELYQSSPPHPYSPIKNQIVHPLKKKNWASRSIELIGRWVSVDENCS